MMLHKLKKVDSIGIISDGIISNKDINDGSFLPAVIIHKDASDEFAELIKIHKDLPSGDVTTTWGWHPFKKSSVFLQLEFKRPSVAKIAIRLDAAEEFSIIEGILRSKCLYLIIGDYGDKPSNAYGKKLALIIEVIPELMNGKWGNVALEALTKKFRNKFPTKKLAKIAAKQHMQSVSNHFDLNMKELRQRAIDK